MLAYIQLPDGTHAWLTAAQHRQHGGAVLAIAGSRAARALSAWLVS